MATIYQECDCCKKSHDLYLMEEIYTNVDPEDMEFFDEDDDGVTYRCQECAAGECNC